MPRPKTDIYCVDKGVTGVYALVHKPTGFVYVGGSGYCIYNRFRHHFVKLRQGMHATPKLQALWSDSKSEEFCQVVLTLCPKSEVKEYEQYWINFFKGSLLNGSPDAARKRWADPEYRKAVTEKVRIITKERRARGELSRESWSDEAKLSFSRKTSERTVIMHAEGKFGRASWTDESREKYERTIRSRKS